MRTDIDCPEDTLHYNCSVIPNSENVDLTWFFTLPGQMPRSIMYGNTSTIGNEDNLDSGVITLLVEYRSDYIESIMILTVLSNISLDGSMVQCSLSNMDNASSSMLVSINTSGELYTVITTSYPIIIIISYAQCSMNRDN